VDPSTRFFEKRRTWKTDRDGDIRMKGAKVSMEKARKERLCFECGIAGHQARNCRKRQAGGRNDKNVRIRMVRTGRTSGGEESGSGTLEKEDPTSTAVTKMFENLTLGDFETEPSTDEEGDAKPTSPKERFNFEEWAETQEVRRRSEPRMEAMESTIELWRAGLTDEGRARSMYRSYPRTQGYRGRHRPMGRRSKEQRNAQITTSEVPVRQADETPQHHRIQVSA
jgi:hypothetical protein